MSSIIITGVSGFIGSALARYLLEQGNHKVIGIDRESWSDFDKLYSEYKNVVFFKQDINDDLPRFNEPIYAVVHLAARAGVRNSHENFKEVCKDNILGTQSVIKVCIESWKPKKLLVASSSSVYGDNGNLGEDLQEEKIRCPKSPYAMSKCATEDLLETYRNCGLLEGVDATAMRFFTVYGPNQRNELAIRSFIDHIIRDEPITIFGDGNQTRDFTHISDICKGINALLTYRTDSPVYNIGSGKCYSINDIVVMISGFTNKKVTIEWNPKDKYDVDSTLANTSRLREMMWKPEKDFREGLKEQIEWQQSLI